MSKQADAKKAQGWSKEPMCCQNCSRCVETKTHLHGAHGYEYDRVHRKCGEGGFAVSPRNCCGFFEFKK